ncbi:hypothetical protein JKI95_07830 [Corynebacterium aquatimens]|uniref:hypothetical protein n=1 Tax=Corynebacterium TaxID=1716 RepID=UPI001F25B325|nr:MULTISPECIES: hypothetical protein [Corynebacterium]QYH19145.1 hypothetical protein JKI95_07830 [Corynebacterium aquatimens]UIZ91986.1 hypothetical protein JZY91_09945 [Corynebacterium sp. CNCTC7651]
MNQQSIDELRNYYDNSDISEALEDAEPTAFGDQAGPDAMSAFTVRLPTHVLNAVREIARREGRTTGAVLRSMVELGVAETASDDAVVPVSELRKLISSAKGA